MKPQIRAVARDGYFLSGLLFLAIGIGALGIALDYHMGSPGRMGPGFFPVAVCSGLAILGIAMIANSLRSGHEPRPVEVSIHAIRPFIFVLGSVLLFGLLLERLGLILAVLIVVMFARFGDSPYRVLRSAILAVGMVIVTTLVFYESLGLPFPLVPE